MASIADATADPQAFLAGLVASVTTTLPAAESTGQLTVDRDRSLGDRLAGRPGTITGFRFDAQGEALTLRYATGFRWTSEVARVSGGVIISRKSLPLGEWLERFAGRVAASAADAAGDAAVSARALQALGIQPAGGDIQIDDNDLAGGLKALPALLAGRVPDLAIDLVGRIGDLIADTVPRVVGSGEPEIVVRRTATTYLPDTLRAYLSLPSDWVVGHVFPDGSTPEDALIAQLSTLEAAASRMRDSAVEQDAAALQINGRFLSDRFATSSLDL